MIEHIKTYKTAIILIGIIVLFVCACNSRLIMYTIPKGEYLNSLESPNGEYTLKSYRCGAGATVDFSVRVEVIDNKTKKATNIYYRYHDYEADMEWLDNETVLINGIKLNIHKDYYKKY